METERRAKMPPAQRAKQFMPFAALTGFDDELFRQEECAQARAEIFEGEVERLDRMLRRLRVGAEVRLVSYFDGKYTPFHGFVTAFSAEQQYLELDRTRIFFEDIRRIDSVD